MARGYIDIRIRVLDNWTCWIGFCHWSIVARLWKWLPKALLAENPAPVVSATPPDDSDKRDNGA